MTRSVIASLPGRSTRENGQGAAKQSHVVVLFLVLSIACVSHAGDAGLPGAFLNWGAGGRAMGMGKAFTAVADDASAVYWNPAGLTRLAANEVTAMHVTLFEDTMYDFVGYAHSFPKIGSFGLAVVRVGSTGFEGRAEDGDDRGSFDISDLGVLFAYGYPLSQRVSIGGTAKLVRQQVGVYSASGGGVDVGMMYYAHKVLTFGLSVKNFLAPSIMLREQGDKFPLKRCTYQGLD